MIGDLRQQANESAMRFAQALAWAHAHGMLSADTQYVSNEQARQQMDEIDKLIEEATRDQPRTSG